MAGAAPQSPSKGKGKANAEPQGISGVSGRKADGRTRQASKVDRQVLDYVEVVSVTAKKVSSCQWRSYPNDFSTDNAIQGEGKTASKTASSKTSATRKTLFTPIPDEVVSSEDEEEHHRSDSEEEDELDDDSREADADGDDVVVSGTRGNVCNDLISLDRCFSTSQVTRRRRARKVRRALRRATGIARSPPACRTASAR